MSEIIAGCYQFKVAVAEPEANLRRVGEALPHFADAGRRFVVLPEMWSCGFPYSRLREMAEATPSILDALREWAVRFRMVLVGSLPEAAGDSIFNTSYVVDADGAVVGAYRKMHLFSPHGEELHFKRGERPVVCCTAVGRVGVMICYALRFPELARRLALDGAEILCVSALWPAARVDHWSLLLRGRAVENQLFVVGCNGCGDLGKMTMGGASAVIAPTGEVIAEAGAGESRLTATLRMADMEDFRRRIPCFFDRLPGAYNIV